MGGGFLLFLHIVLVEKQKCRKCKIIYKNFSQILHNSGFGLYKRVIIYGGSAREALRTKKTKQTSVERKKRKEISS